MLVRETQLIHGAFQFQGTMLKKGPPDLFTPTNAPRGVCELVRETQLIHAAILIMTSYKQPDFFIRLF